MSYTKATRDRRQRWREKRGLCMNPECHRGLYVYFHTHEIIGGTADRPKTVKDSAFWLFVCSDCHDQLPSRPNADQLAMQLAWKKLADPERYEPHKVIRMWRPKATPELVREVMRAVAAELKRLKEAAL